MLVFLFHEARARRPTLPSARSLCCSWLLVLAIVVNLQYHPVVATLSCTSTEECQRRVKHVASECQKGVCTNPFHKGGCLWQYQQQRQLTSPQEEDDELNSLTGDNDDDVNNSNRLRDSNNENFPGDEDLPPPTPSQVFWRNRSPRVRVCNSEDPPDAVLKGHCRYAAWSYPEIRMFAQNWESPALISWILQILLSELVDVPSTIDVGRSDLMVNFYNVNASFGYGASLDLDGIRRASTIPNGDCTPYQSSSEQCYHVVPELWNAISRGIPDLQAEGYVESILGLGALGIEAWSIPSFTFQQDPSLISYLGLAGPENRRKMAEMFLRPTTWDFYCTYLSNTSCTEPDGVAQRAPMTPEEKDRMFVAGLYTGHFRKTEQNDCDKWPHNCTGHIADWPCGWNSHVEAQVHHLDIALRSDGPEGRPGGYKSSQLIEIWDAANATRNNVIMLYWTPSVLSQRYAKSPFELIKVYLPPPSLRCVNQRGGGIRRCDTDDPSIVFGDPVGACDEDPQILSTILASSLFDKARGPDVPAEQQSPGYDVVKNFRISEFQIGEVLQGLLESSSEEAGYAARVGVCQWVIDNLDELLFLVPPTFPRTIRREERQLETPVLDAVLTIVACAALVATLGSGVAVVFVPQMRRGSYMDFLVFMLVGLVLVSIGALLLTWTTSDTLCVAVEYFTNLGYVLELVPLTLEVSSTASVTDVLDLVVETEQTSSSIGATGLWKKTLPAFLVMIGFLVAWTIVDPPHNSSDFELPTDTSVEFGADTVVVETFHCSGDMDGWKVGALLWQLLVLFVTCIMALSTGRSSRRNHEVRTFILLTYSHLIFVVLRTMLFFVKDQVGRSRALGYRSLLYSLDVVATLAIYFVPKFFVHEVPVNRRTLDSSVSSLRVSGSNWQGESSFFSMRDSMLESFTDDSIGDLLARYGYGGEKNSELFSIQEHDMDDEVTNDQLSQSSNDKDDLEHQIATTSNLQRITETENEVECVHKDVVSSDSLNGSTKESRLSSQDHDGNHVNALDEQEPPKPENLEQPQFDAKNSQQEPENNPNTLKDPIVIQSGENIFVKKNVDDVEDEFSEQKSNDADDVAAAASSSVNGDKHHQHNTIDEQGMLLL